MHNISQFGALVAKAGPIIADGPKAISAVITNQPFPARTLLVTLFVTAAAVALVVWVISKIVSSK